MQLAAVFRRAEELGVTMLNSAEFYGADRINEKLIAKHGGPNYQISLKVGGVGDLNTGHIRMTSSPMHLRETVDEALKILGRDYIDVIVQARQDPETPVEDVMRVFKELVEAGACTRRLWQRKCNIDCVIAWHVGALQSATMQHLGRGRSTPRQIQLS